MNTGDLGSHNKCVVSLNTQPEFISEKDDMRFPWPKIFPNDDSIVELVCFLW